MRHSWVKETSSVKSAIQAGGVDNCFESPDVGLGAGKLSESGHGLVGTEDGVERMIGCERNGTQRWSVHGQFSSVFGAPGKPLCWLRATPGLEDARPRTSGGVLCLFAWHTAAVEGTREKNLHCVVPSAARQRSDASKTRS